MKKSLLFLIPIIVFSFSSCKKDYLETKPSDGVTEDQIFSKFTSVSATLEGIYKEQFAYGTGGGSRSDIFGQKTNDMACDLMGNDMVVNTQGYGWFNADYNLTEWLASNSFRQSDIAWYMYYEMIKNANKLINNVDGVTDATTAQKESVKGQSYGIRAYCYFYLVNYFQQTYKGHENSPGVPIYTTDTTGGKGRGTVQAVYTQIISDLQAAEPLLTGKTRALKSNIDLSVIQALRARVALLMEDWPTAATYANKARSTYTLMGADVYPTRTAFSSVANSECMWGSIITEDQATIYASFFSHIDVSTGGYAALGGQKKITKDLYDQIPAGDIRKTVFVAPGAGTTNSPTYNQLKFQVPVPGKWAADYFYITAAEMYLIEAEALARQGGKDAQAQTVLETMVKKRYPAYSAAGFSGQSLINEILLQRRIELWGEGWSLLDIKRLNQGLNRPTGPGNHGSPNFDPGVYTTSAADARFLMRIPDRELNNNSSMTPTDQNP